MAALHFQGHTVACRDGESVLDAFVRAGLDIAFSCKSGVCHRCMLKSIEGTVPHEASRKLPPRLREAGYLLACQCQPVAEMVLAPRSLEDMLTECMLMHIDEAPGQPPVLSFDTATELAFHPGQPARLVGLTGLTGLMDKTEFTDPTAAGGEEHSSNTPTSSTSSTSASAEPELILLGRHETEGWVQARLNLKGTPRPAWLDDPDGMFGASFQIRGPFPSEPESEQPGLAPDPALWAALDNGKTVRAVLETFYTKVYADPLLSPYFERVTRDRVIGKQYAFLMQSITGEAVYIGERPRNSHHWMVIPDSVFDHRQKLMLDAQHEHGLSDALIERWSAYEEHFRPDIVKYSPWPKRIGDQVIDTERYDTVRLDEATVCDHCGAEIDAGTVVRYHVRLGKVSCSQCAAVTAETA